MTDTTALFADIEKRLIRGLLLPFGELSAPNETGNEPVMFSAGTVELPADPSVISANEDHSQFKTRGRAISLEETDAGIVAEFSIARTPEGDALLAAANDPDKAKRPRLSAEINKLVRDGAKAVSSVLTGAGFVPQGAFPSAALFALALEAEKDDEGLTQQITEAVSVAVAEALAALAKGDDTDPEDSPSTDEQKEQDMAQALLPDGLTPPVDLKKDKTSANGLFAALARQDKAALKEMNEAGSALFSISTIQQSGPTTLTIGVDTSVPQFLQELHARRPYARKYAPLFNSQALSSYKITGWRWVEGKEPVVGSYTGNTAEIPSNAVDTEPVEETAERIAGGHKLDRKFVDFGDSSVYASYLAKMHESYLRVSDAKALGYATAAATACVPGAVPADIAAGLAAIIDGALGVIASENSPSFAVVSPELWRDIVLTGKNEVLGYLSAGFGLEEGSVDGFRILPGAVGTGKVLVGAKEAMTVFELPGVPIRVEGIDPHHGAIDPALFGYLGKVVEAPKALQLVTIATVPAG